MSDLIIASSSVAKIAVPMPKVELTFRTGNAGDFDFIDELQKQYNKNLGFMPKAWLEGKVKANQILVALIDDERVGYIIAQDRYMKRDDLGIVYQIAVKPVSQRAFIGAALLKAQFDRSAHGCRMYCCWCAQDLQANHFWEAMGFVPLAFRNGADKKGKNGKPRVHIFWEKKIRGNEDTCHWWFPSKTEAGAMGADRLALPIRPGVHWSEVEPIEIPVIGGERLIEDQTSKQSKPKKIKPIISTSIKPSRMMFGPATVEKKIEGIVPVIQEKIKKPKKPKVKIDPTFIAASRELRDRYLEQVNENGFKLESAGKYELVRNAPHAKSESPRLLPCVHGRGDQIKLLDAA